MKTQMSPKIYRNKITIDATGKILGSLAVEIANLLRGKNKIFFVSHLDIGDFVEVDNPQNIKLTGNKLNQKLYIHHTGYIGNLKTITLKNRLLNDPEGIIRDAVRGMMPHNRLSKGWLKRLSFKFNSQETK